MKNAFDSTLELYSISADIDNDVRKNLARQFEDEDTFSLEVMDNWGSVSHYLDDLYGEWSEVEEEVEYERP